MTEPPDSFRALLAGGEQAWTELARRVRQEWRGLTVRYVGEAAADDLLQEVFIRVYTHRDEIQDTAHLNNFVRLVWNQRVVDHWRRSGTRAREVDDGQGAQTNQPPEVRADPATQAQRAEFLGVIDRSPMLAADQKLIVKFHLLDDLALAEVARILGRNPASVETTYYRALELLRLDLALTAWRDGRGGQFGHLPERQRAALDLLAQGLSEKEVARRLGVRVPEVRRLLAPAIKALCEQALGEWQKVV